MVGREAIRADGRAGGHSGGRLTIGREVIRADGRAGGHSGGRLTIGLEVDDGIDSRPGSVSHGGCSRRSPPEADPGRNGRAAPLPGNNRRLFA